MKNYISTLKTHLSRHKKILSLVALVVIIGIAAFLIIWGIRSHRTVYYTPAKACDMLSVARARSALGQDVLNVEADKPVTQGNIATSQCGYSDVNSDDMHVEALVVKSAVNPKGVTELKDAFKKEKSVKTNTAISDLGDSAYFNTKLGLLYVLNGRQVLIVSYGSGANMQANNPDSLTKIAKQLLAKSSSEKTK